MGGRVGVLALVAMSATGALQGISSAQSGTPPAPDPQVAVVEPPSSRSLDAICLQAAPPRGLRPLGPEAEELLAEARRLSPTVRRQLAALERSDLLVYVEVRPVLPTHTARLGLVGSAGGVRYLKIEIHATNRGSAGISWLAHELQHAIEIASAADVTDQAGFMRLYRRIGRRSFNSAGEFETAAAIRVGNQVTVELRSTASALMAARLPR